MIKSNESLNASIDILHGAVRNINKSINALEVEYTIINIGLKNNIDVNIILMLDIINDIKTYLNNNDIKNNE